MQIDRLKGTGAACNAQMGPRLISRWARPDDGGRRLLERAAASLGLSARAFHRILRVARTIADLDGADSVAAAHVAEAISYRCLDRHVEERAVPPGPSAVPVLGADRAQRAPGGG